MYLGLYSNFRLLPFRDVNEARNVEAKAEAEAKSFEAKAKAEARGQIHKISSEKLMPNCDVMNV